MINITKLILGDDSFQKYYLSPTEKRKIDVPGRIQNILKKF